MIRWTHQAATDFTGQIAWLRERDPVAAVQVAEDVLAKIETLQTFPFAGRSGRRKGTRELATTPRQLVVVYKPLDRDVVILRVLHGAQLWLAED